MDDADSKEIMDLNQFSPPYRLCRLLGFCLHVKERKERDAYFTFKSFKS